MHPIKIKSGIADVIASGTVIAFKNNPVEFIFEEGNKIILAFQDDDNEGGPKASVEITDSNTLRILNKNFKNPLGDGTTSPIYLGNFRNRLLYINYRIYDLGGPDKQINYTFYLGEEFKNNE
jgi:hypothetical protein